MEKEILQAILNITQDSVAVIDRDFKYILFNHNYFHAVERIYNRQISIGKDVHDFITNEEDKEVSLANFQKCLHGESVTVINRYGNKNFDTSIFEVKLFPFHSAGKEIEGIVLWVKNITENEAIQEENALITTRLENAESSARMGSWEVDVVTGGGWWSKNMYRIFGFPIGSTPPPLEDYLEHIHEDDRGLAMSAIESLLKGDIPDSIEYRTNPKYTELRVLSPTYQNAKIESGKVIKIMGTIIDITDLKNEQVKVSNLLGEKDLLLKEVLHRINNNMSILLSILNLQSANTHDLNLKNILKDIESRIHSMNILYNKLFRMNSLTEMSAKEYFDAILKDIRSIYKVSDSIIIDIRIEPIVMNAKILFTLGLIVNELISNSLKYAFLNRHRGVILFQLTKVDENIKLVLQDDGEWTEDKKTNTNKSGFGLQLVDMLASQLKAKWTLNKEGGTRYEFVFSLGKDEPGWKLPQSGLN